MGKVFVNYGIIMISSYCYRTVRVQYGKFLIFSNLFLSIITKYEKRGKYLPILHVITTLPYTLYDKRAITTLLLVAC